MTGLHKFEPHKPVALCLDAIGGIKAYLSRWEGKIHKEGQDVANNALHALEAMRQHAVDEFERGKQFGITLSIERIEHIMRTGKR